MSSSPLIILARKAFFSSGISYFNPLWSQERNLKVFGKHAGELGHGYSFCLEIRLAGHCDPVTSLVVNLTEIDQDLMKVVSLLDKKHLGMAGGDEMKFQIPTLENISQFCFMKLQEKLGDAVVGIKLTQGQDDWVEILA